MSTIPTTAPTAPVEGSKIVKSTPKTPVMITRLRTVGMDKQTIEAQLEQMFEQPVGGQSGILGLTMQGHTAFNSGDRKKVAWQNFSTVMAIKLGIIASWEQVGNSQIEIEGKPPILGALLIAKELVIPNAKGQKLPLKLVEVDTYEPRKWVDRNGVPQQQTPKRAGADGDILLRDGKQIYRNTGLSMPGADDQVTGRAWDEDLVIIHNNQIQSSAVRAALAKSGIGQPSMPRPLQNAPIGLTNDLVSGAPEPTRHNPDDQQQDVAEKTLAEQHREEEFNK